MLYWFVTLIMQENIRTFAKLQKNIAIEVIFFVSPSMTTKAKSIKKRESRVVLLSIIALSVALLMAVGPGVLLVNHPETFLGLPLVYAWAIFWYLVICVIAWLTDRLIWSKDSLVGEDSNGSC